MDNASFFSDLLNTIAERGRALIGAKPPRGAGGRVGELVARCRDLLSGRGEATGAAIAIEILDDYRALDAPARLAFFSALAAEFGPDRAAMTRALEHWGRETSDAAAADLHYAAEPRRLELFRRLNRAPGGTGALVAMRADLLPLLREAPALRVVDRDLLHLFASWFNRGFLVLRHIDWRTPANILEKLIRYEAVHQIHDWDDLRRRIDPPDRRCYAFFHPALVDEPLIFVEVALTETMPAAVAPLLAQTRLPVAPDRARVAVFYSISNCQTGLAGVTFGNFLIKQVVEELRRELPRIETFVTLSPIPGLRAWVESEEPGLDVDARATLALAGDADWPDDAQAQAKLRKLLEPLIAQYFLQARRKDGRVIDPVARFHLGNGARLERIDWLGDRSHKGLRESFGAMVNYLYDLDEIERNHEAFANQGEVAASSAVKKMLKDRKRRAPAPTPA